MKNQESLSFAEFGLLVVNLALAKGGSSDRDCTILSKYKPSTKAEKAIVRASIAVKVRQFLLSTLKIGSVPELPDQICMLSVDEG